MARVTRRAQTANTKSPQRNLFCQFIGPRLNQTGYSCNLCLNWASGRGFNSHRLHQPLDLREFPRITFLLFMTIPDLSPLHAPSGESRQEQQTLQSLWTHALGRYKETLAFVSSFDPTQQSPQQFEDYLQFYSYFTPELATQHHMPDLANSPKCVVCF